MLKFKIGKNTTHVKSVSCANEILFVEVLLWTSLLSRKKHFINTKQLLNYVFESLHFMASNKLYRAISLSIPGYVDQESRKIFFCETFVLKMFSSF